VAGGNQRRSTDRQEPSIPHQRRAIERSAAEHDLELARYFVDDAISGTSAVPRPAFQEMVGLVRQERRPFSYVIVYDVKRFGRLDNDEAGSYRHRCATGPPPACDPTPAHGPKKEDRGPAGPRSSLGSGSGGLMRSTAEPRAPCRRGNG